MRPNLEQSLSSSRDRITQMLSQQAQPASFGQEVGDISQSLLSALSQKTGAAGYQQAYGQAQQQRQQQAQSQIQSQMNLHKMMQEEVTQGNEEAAAVDKAIKDITGNDIAAYEKIAAEMHNSPEPANRRNATLLASRAAVKMGYKPMALESDKLDMDYKRAQIGKLNADAAKAAKIEKTGMTGVDPVLARQVDKDVILKNREAGMSADKSLRALNQIENIFFDAKGSPKVNTGKTQGMLEAVGQFIPGVDSEAYQSAKAKTNEMSMEIASMLKGQTSDRDVARSIETVPSFSYSPAANKQIIKDKRAALKVVSEMPRFVSQWRSKYGSTIGTDEQGRTFDEAYLDWQSARFQQLGGRKGGIESSEIDSGSQDQNQYGGYSYKIRDKK